MALKFRHKVFLILFLNSLLVVICMLLIGRYYAHRNFEEYVEKVEIEKLDDLAEVLTLEYRRSGNWETVLDDWGKWLGMAGMRPGRPQAPDNADRPPFPLPPPVFSTREDAGEGPPPPLGDPHPPRPHGPPSLPDHRPFPPHITLFDAEKHPLTRTDDRPESSPADNYRMKSILVDDRVVGWLGIGRPKGLRSPLDAEFIRHQSRMLYTTGAVTLTLAFLVTLLLSRHLLAPLKELAKGTRALASRRFDTRMPIRTRDEFGQLASDFNAMAQTLERYEQMRRQWIADISHELRTPLSILRGEIEAMQDGVREVTPEGLESLHFEVMHLGRIVQALHDLSLIESGDVELTIVDPLKILGETLGAFRTRLEGSGLRVQAEGSGVNEVTIKADADRLKQVFSNILENALRYVHLPGVLTVTRKVDEGFLLLHFDDTGPGAPDKSLPHLFDRLYRVDTARSRAHGGSGLGLAICKGIVESFGGRIEASHAPSGGLRITISLPVLSV